MKRYYRPGLKIVENGADDIPEGLGSSDGRSVGGLTR